MFRAPRLVDRPGLDHYRGSREKAVAYYNDSLGTPEGSNVTGIERYCVWPGQATSYMVGQTRWVAIREKAKATLGDKFALRAFHDTTLSAGPLPIDVRAGWIDRWGEAQPAYSPRDPPPPASRPPCTSRTHGIPPFPSCRIPPLPCNITLFTKT